jgi:hypothetical protein
MPTTKSQRQAIRQRALDCSTPRHELAADVLFLLDELQYANRRARGYRNAEQEAWRQLRQVHERNFALIDAAKCQSMHIFAQPASNRLTFNSIEKLGFLFIDGGEATIDAREIGEVNVGAGSVKIATKPEHATTIGTLAIGEKAKVGEPDQRHPEADMNPAERIAYRAQKAFLDGPTPEASIDAPPDESWRDRSPLL